MNLLFRTLYSGLLVGLVFLYSGCSDDSAETPTSDLSLGSKINENNPIYGDEVQITITLTNTGPADNRTVLVQNKISTGFSYVNHNASTGAFDSSTGVWSIDSLANAKSETLVLDVIVNEEGTYEQQSEIIMSEVEDPNIENNQSSIAIVPSAPSSDLSLFQFISIEKPYFNEEIQFTIRLLNDGPSTTGVTVKDLLPSGYTYLSHESEESYDPATGLWDVSAIESGAEKFLILKVKVNESGDYNNTAEVVNSDNSDPDSTPGNNSEDEDDQVTLQVAPGLPSSLTVSTLATLNAADAIELKDGVLYASSYGQSKVYRVFGQEDFEEYLSLSKGLAGIAFDAANNMVLARYDSSDIVKINPDKEIIEIIRYVANPIAVEIDSEGNIWTNNHFNNAITKIDKNGNLDIITTANFDNSSLAFDDNEDIYVSDYESPIIRKINKQTRVESVFATLSVDGVGYITYSNGSFYATSIRDQVVLRISMDGTSEIIAGTQGESGLDDGYADRALFHNPIGIVMSEDGTKLYVAQNGGDGAIRVITGFDQ